MRMAPTCAVCGTKFEREHGYFLNAIFVAYAIYGVLFAPIALYGYFTQRFLTVTIFFVIAILLLAPFTFRYSRVLWLYFDEAMDPRPEPIPDAE